MDIMVLTLKNTHLRAKRSNIPIFGKILRKIPFSAMMREDYSPNLPSPPITGYARNIEIYNSCHIEKILGKDHKQGKAIPRSLDMSMVAWCGCLPTELFQAKVKKMLFALLIAKLPPEMTQKKKKKTKNDRT